ncbi:MULTISPECIES: Acg family FMN-binding oxidoreductase [unclassified Kribbella]|uniref:Acg family FMN-binding oxidoreductase n=1 Tax=unclassified Kribbella TaxID=2644121 RepID=UPI00301618D0
MSDVQLSTEQIDVLLRAAIAAPSMHNTQPWRFEVNGLVIDVYLDGSRTLPAEDPTGRAMRIAAGTATFNLRCAAASLGYATWLGLAPDAEEPDLLARIVLEPSSTTDQRLRDLYAEIPRRHTSRDPIRTAPLAQQTRIDLAKAALADGAELTWLSAEQIETVVDMFLDTDLREIGDWRRSAERAHWVGGNRADDGIPSSALGPRASSYRTAFRDLGTRPADRTRTQAAFEQHPNLAVLSTEHDEPADQVSAGIALERVLLTATGHGVAASFLNQPLEYDDLRQKVQRMTGRAGFADMVIRFGHAHPSGSTPRRPVEDFVHIKEK